MTNCMGGRSYFTLDVPQYSSQRILHQKLLYAVRNCREMTTDNDVDDEAFALLAERSGIAGDI